MNFLIDANLPRRLANLFRERGHRAVHTLDLPHANATEDTAILRYADEENCVITTKDSDFITSFWLNNRPNKLLLVSTGNINNKELESLLVANFEQIINDLSNNRFVELSRDHVIVHA
jgi:predicted nuclease of predicted toxin-antitoxin system